MISPAEFAKATALMYWDAARLASSDLARNWPILPGSIGLFGAYLIGITLFSGMGFAGGMIAGLIQISLLCLYYSWISQSVQKERLRFQDLLQFDYGLFFNIISVAFIIFIVQFLLQMLTTGLDATFLILAVQLGIVLIFNAIPEVIHLNRIESVPALSEAAKFTRDNWIEWYLPFVVIIAPWLLIDPESVLAVLSHSDPLLPPFIIVRGSQTLAGHSSGLVQLLLPLITLVIANWLMLFRAHLFQALESGTRRQRIFKAKTR